MNDSAIGEVMVRANKITAVLSKGLRGLWVFFLISVTIFGLALTLTTLNHWPQMLIGLVITVSPYVIWNIEKILTLACQMLCHTLRFTFRVIHKTITLIYKRKWIAFLFWIIFFLWDREWTLGIAILFLFLKLIKKKEPLSDDKLGSQKSPQSDWDKYWRRQQEEDL